MAIYLKGNIRGQAHLADSVLFWLSVPLTYSVHICFYVFACGTRGRHLLQLMLACHSTDRRNLELSDLTANRRYGISLCTIKCHQLWRKNVSSFLTYIYGALLANVSWLMVFKVTTGLYSDNRTKHISALCGQNVDLNLKVGAVCSYLAIYRFQVYAVTFQSMYVCMYVCTHVCMYSCMYVCMYACISVCMYVCMYVCIHVCMYVCVYVCV
jgi:hypothetical protein